MEDLLPMMDQAAADELKRAIVKRAVVRRAAKRRAVKKAVAKKAVKRRVVKKAVKRRAVKKAVAKKAVKRRVVKKAAKKRAVKKAVVRRAAKKNKPRSALPNVSRWSSRHARLASVVRGSVPHRSTGRLSPSLLHDSSSSRSSRLRSLIRLPSAWRIASASRRLRCWSSSTRSSTVSRAMSR